MTYMHTRRHVHKAKKVVPSAPRSSKSGMSPGNMPAQGAVATMKGKYKRRS